MKRTLLATVLLAPTLYGYIGTSAYTLQGIKRTYSANTAGKMALTINFFQLTGSLQGFEMEDTVLGGVGTQAFNDQRAVADYYGGMGFSTELLEIALTGNFKGDAWEKQGERGGFDRQESLNRSSILNLGDLLLGVKLSFPIGDKKQFLGAGIDIKFPTGSKFDPNQTADTTDTWGIRYSGGVWRSFTQGSIGFAPRAMFSYFPNEYLDVHLNVGYDFGSLANDDTTLATGTPFEINDDRFTAGASLMFRLGAFHPFFEVYTEQFTQHNGRFGGSPVWLTPGFRIDFLNGLVVDFAGEFIVRDVSSIDTTTVNPPYNRVFPNDPNFYLPNWKPDWGAWVGLSYIWVGVKEEVKPTHGIFAGTIIDKETSKPVSGFVSIPEAGISPLQADPSTGVFKLDSVSSGTYTIKAEAAGYEPWGEAIVIKAGETTVKTIYLSPIKVAVIPKATLTGRVIDSETGEAIAGIINFPETEVASAQASDAGTFKVEELAVGAVAVMAEAPGYTSETKMVNLKEGSNVVEFKLTKETVPKKAVLTGKIVDKRNQNPIGGGFVTLVGAGLSPGQSDQTGIYRVENIPSGAMTVKVEAPGYKPYSEVINFSENQVLVKDFALEPSVVKGTIVVKVSDRESGAPLGATLTFVGANLPDATADAATGVYQGELAAGVFTISAKVTSAEGYVPQVKTVTMEGDAVLQVEFQMVKAGTKITFRNVYFATAKSTIRAESYPVIDEMYNFLMENPSAKVEIQGHTDSRGSDSYNQRLSEARANAVRTYLLKKGVDPDRLTAKGYGESQLEVSPERTDADYQMNRRVVILVTGIRTK